MSTLVDVDQELAQLESRKRQLEAAKESRKFELQGRLVSLQHQLTARQSKLNQIEDEDKRGVADPNSFPAVRKLAEAYWAADTALNDFARRCYFEGADVRTRPGHFERRESEIARLRAERDAARAQYEAAVEAKGKAKGKELQSAHEQATTAERAQAESAITELQRQIETTENELKRIRP